MSDLFTKSYCPPITRRSVASLEKFTYIGELALKNKQKTIGGLVHLEDSSLHVGMLLAIGKAKKNPFLP